LARRYLKFCVVGGSGVVVDMALLHVLSSPSILGWNLSLSKALAAEVGLVNNFIWNEVWTFRDLTEEEHGERGGSRDETALAGLKELNRLNRLNELRRASAAWRRRLARFVKFNLICTAGIGLSVLLLNVQVYGLGWNVYLSNFIAIVLVSLWNFFLNLKFGWKGPSPEGEARPQRDAD
jgi:dolichol-phosphate mannosyltransferase